MFQGCKSELMFVLIAGDSHVNFGCTFVVGQPDVGNSDCAQPRILELIPNDLSNLLANRIRYSFRTMHLSIYYCAGSACPTNFSLSCVQTNHHRINKSGLQSDARQTKVRRTSNLRFRHAPAYCSCRQLLTTTLWLPLAQRRTPRSDPQP